MLGEVVEGPYQSALQNVADNGLEDKIEVRLANGLAAFEPTDGISCITIAGMGGRLIADILAAGLEKLASVSRLVLQPNNREDELRAWLVDNDFRIVDEASWKKMRSSMRSSWWNRVIKSCQPRNYALVPI